MRDINSQVDLTTHRRFLPRKMQYIHLDPHSQRTPANASRCLSFSNLTTHNQGEKTKSSRLLYRIRGHERVHFQILENGLVHDEHSAALHARPDGAWTDAAEPAGDAFSLVDDF